MEVCHQVHGPASATLTTDECSR